MATTYTPTSTSGTTYSTLNSGDIIQCNFITNNAIPVTIPAGTYKLECYGAQGGYGRALTKTTTSSSDQWVSPSDNDFSIMEIMYGNFGRITGNAYRLQVGGSSSGLSDGQTGYITAMVYTSGTYKLNVIYETETNFDKFNIVINSVPLYQNASGSNLTGTSYTYNFVSGTIIKITYSKDTSNSIGLDFVAIDIQKLSTTASSETWNYGTQTAGGYGGYSTGVLNLKEPTQLYLCPGGMGGYNATLSGTPTTSVSIGGYNGGGDGNTYIYNDVATFAGAGGGASDIRIGSNSLYARVIVAGGGGGSAGINDITNKRGGGETGASSISGYYGTQTQAGNGGSFGAGGNATGSSEYKYGAGGGGGGWYGGGTYTGSSNSSEAYRTYNGGGSGYVYTDSTANNYPSGCLLSSKYYLTDASTSTATQTGNGQIKITVLEVPTPLIDAPGYIKIDATTWVPIEKIYIKTTTSKWEEGIL